MKYTRVVCTGASGNIGRHLPSDAIALKIRLEDSIENMRVELNAVDCTGAAFLHLAAMTSVRDSEQNPQRALNLNVEGALKWLSASASVGCRRFVHVSTSHVFRPTSTPEWLKADRSGDAISVYGRSKLEAERRLLADGEKLGVEVVIARVFSIIGEDMKGDFLYPALQRRAKERDLRPLPGYKNVRDFIEASDAARHLWCLALSAPLNKQIFHVCTGRPRSVQDLAIEVIERSGIKGPALAAMFPENQEKVNYLISKPTLIAPVSTS